VPVIYVMYYFSNYIQHTVLREVRPYNIVLEYFHKYDNISLISWINTTGIEEK